MDEVEGIGGGPRLRVDGKGMSVLTDQGNQIIDCHFGEIADPGVLAAALDGIPGVVEHGLFLGMARAALIGDGGSVRRLGA